LSWSEASTVAAFACSSLFSGTVLCCSQRLKQAT
jgi:hypothetical protein